MGKKTLGYNRRVGLVEVWPGRSWSVGKTSNWPHQPVSRSKPKLTSFNDKKWKIQQIFIRMTNKCWRFPLSVIKVIVSYNRNLWIFNFLHDGYFWWMNGNSQNFKQNNTFNLRKTQELLLPRSEKRIWKQISRQSWLVQSHLESFKSKLS